MLNVPPPKTFPTKHFIGKRNIMSFANNTTFELFNSFMPRRKEITNNIGSEIYCIQEYELDFFKNFDLNKKFSKWAAVEVLDFTTIPEGMETITIPSGLHAVFNFKGTAAEAPAFFQYIFMTWLPNSEYELDDRPHFEILGEKYKNNDPSSEEEVWIPVKLKNNF